MNAAKAGSACVQMAGAIRDKLTDGIVDAEIIRDRYQRDKTIPYRFKVKYRVYIEIEVQYPTDDPQRPSGLCGLCRKASKCGTL